MLFRVAMPLLSLVRRVRRSPPIVLEAWDPCGVQYCRYHSRKTRTLADTSNFQACGSVIPRVQLEMITSNSGAGDARSRTRPTSKFRNDLGGTIRVRAPGLSELP